MFVLKFLKKTGKTIKNRSAKIFKKWKILPMVFLPSIFSTKVLSIQNANPNFESSAMVQFKIKSNNKTTLKSQAKGANAKIAMVPTSKNVLIMKIAISKILAYLSEKLITEQTAKEKKLFFSLGPAIMDAYAARAQMKLINASPTNMLPINCLLFTTAYGLDRAANTRIVNFHHLAILLYNVTVLNIHHDYVKRLPVELREEAWLHQGLNHHAVGIKNENHLNYLEKLSYSITGFAMAEKFIKLNFFTGENLFLKLFHLDNYEKNTLKNLNELNDALNKSIKDEVALNTQPYSRDFWEDKLVTEILQQKALEMFDKYTPKELVAYLRDPKNDAESRRYVKNGLRLIMFKHEEQKLLEWQRANEKRSTSITDAYVKDMNRFRRSTDESRIDDELPIPKVKKSPKVKKLRKVRKFTHQNKELQQEVNNILEAPHSKDTPQQTQQIKQLSSDTRAKLLSKDLKKVEELQQQVDKTLEELKKWKENNFLNELPKQNPTEGKTPKSTDLVVYEDGTRAPKSTNLVLNLPFKIKYLDKIEEKEISDGGEEIINTFFSPKTK